MTIELVSKKIHLIKKTHTHEICSQKFIEPFKVNPFFRNALYVRVFLEYFFFFGDALHQICYVLYLLFNPKCNFYKLSFYEQLQLISTTLSYFIYYLFIYYFFYQYFCNFFSIALKLLCSILGIEISSFFAAMYIVTFRYIFCCGYIVFGLEFYCYL